MDPSLCRGTGGCVASLCLDCVAVTSGAASARASPSKIALKFIRNIESVAPLTPERGTQLLITDTEDDTDLPIVGARMIDTFFSVILFSSACCMMRIR